MKKRYKSLKANILIIGCRASGLFLPYILKKNKIFYFGRGESFELLKKEYHILMKKNSSIKAYTVNNFYKLNEKNISKSNFDCIFFAINETSINKALVEYNNILKTAKVIFLLQPSTVNYLKVRSYIKNSRIPAKVFRLIITNGIEYISPRAIYVWLDYNPVKIVKDDEDDLIWLENNLFKKIFNSKKVNIVREDNEINKLLFKRHFQTLLSVYSVKYKNNLYGLFNDKRIRFLIEKSFWELAEIIKVEKKDALAAKRDVFRDEEIYLYYPSMFKNKYVRFKREKEWLKFYKELAFLAKENNVELAKKKNILNLFQGI